MRIDEILTGITKLAIKNKKSILSPWRANFVDEINNWGYYSKVIKYKNVEINIQAKPLYNDPDSLEFSFSIDEEIVKSDRYTGADRVDEKLAKKSLMVAAKEAQMILQEIRPKKMIFSAELLDYDSQSESRAQIYDMLMRKVKPKIEAAGYTVLQDNRADSWNWTIINKRFEK